MKRIRDNLHIPFISLLWVLLIFSALLQLAVITYNYNVGFIEIGSYGEFLFRLGYGTLMTLPFAFVIVYLDIYSIRLLNKWKRWNDSIILRIVAQLMLTAVIALIASVLVTILAFAINPYTSELLYTIVINFLIASVVNLLIMASLEAWYFYRENKETKLEAKYLEQELMAVRFEVLKSQINPHFLFNSLNVLSGLINKDRKKAQLFIDEFSQIYRYVLDTIEVPVVSVEKELEFARSYMFLQQIRYGNILVYSVNLQAELLHFLIPPLSLQVVLENAIKHNAISSTNPLNIEIAGDENAMVVRNNYRPKVSKGKSTGLGLINLKKRYQLVCEQEPEFLIDNNYYVVKLPLINHE